MLLRCHASLASAQQVGIHTCESSSFHSGENVRGRPCRILGVVWTTHTHSGADALDSAGSHSRGT